MKRIGVFVCHCGMNIAGVIDVQRVVEEVGKSPGVTHAQDYVYMCSDPGQALLRDTIAEKHLNAVVIAACSPSLHEGTFRTAAMRAGLNPYQCEIVNIREQCSWVHSAQKDAATEKAIRLIQATVEKVKQNVDLRAGSMPICRKALVIGGGISGIQAALDIAEGGYEVFLVERQSSIGGRMAQLSETFPTLDCAQCILTPRMVQVSKHPNIHLLVYSEVEAISGHIGRFRVRLRRKAAYVDGSKCTGCGECTAKCPRLVPSEFDRGLSRRKAIYTPFPQAVPNKPVIDRDSCIYFRNGKCRLCEKACPPGAIDFEQQEEIIEAEVGAVVVATGYDLLPLDRLAEYGCGKVPDVIDGLAFERLLSASGPTLGEVRRPSDGKVPKEVVFVQCAGSRDPEKYLPYCSKICCMYTAKHALLYRHRVPEGQPYVFYIDVRTAGKGYEEFYHRAEEEEEVVYLRGKVSKIFRDGDKTIVWGTDTLSGRNVEIAADLVVLATAVLHAEGAHELANRLKIQLDAHGFFSEAHPKLRPVESITAGFFLAGCAQAPKDIPDTIAQAGCAASKVLDLFASGRLPTQAQIAEVDEERCAACGLCVPACPYEARILDEERNVAEVDGSLCQGCGLCVTACPNKACELKNLTPSQVNSMVEQLAGR